MESLKSEVAAAAARVVVEEGLEYGPAKRRALKLLDLPARTALPDNDAVEDAVREYLALFCADTQPAELLALRELALVWMERLAPFRPHLGGAVWRGTATRLSDLYLHLFCDDAKEVAMALIDNRMDYDVTTATGLRGDAVEGLSLSVPCRALGESVGLHLIVNGYDALRGALQPDARGRSLRGDLAALQGLLAKTTR